MEKQKKKLKATQTSQGSIRFDEQANCFLIKLTAVAISDGYENATADEAKWKKAFEIGSEYLFQATNGQLQIGAVRLDLAQVGSSHGDVLLSNDESHSVAYGDIFNRPVDCTSLRGGTLLKKPSMEYPMEIAHELAHIALGLGDEYVGAGGIGSGRCTNNAASHACMMEFSATRHSRRIVFNDVGTFHILPSSLDEVNQFCLSHDSGTSTAHASCNPSADDQEHIIQYIIYGMKSCWDVITDAFTEMKLPEDFDASSASLRPVDWPDLKSRGQFFVAILGTQGLKDGNSHADLKHSALGIAHLLADTQFQFAHSADQQLTRSLGPVSREELGVGQDASGLVADILNFEPASESGGSFNSLGLDEFEKAGVSAYSRLVLMIPGDAEFSLVGDGSLEQALNGISPNLESRFLDLTIVTVGEGSFADAMKEIEVNSPRFGHTRLPKFPDDRFPGFHALSILPLLHLSETPGFGLVGLRSGIFPATSVRDLFDAPDEVLPAAALLLHPQAEGVDFPVFIETGSTKAWIMLNTITEESVPIRFELIDPQGITVERGERNFEHKVKLIEANVHLPGRWIVRVRRSIEADRKKRKAIPFLIAAAVENPAIHLKASIEVDGPVVEFTSTTFHNSPLDLIDSRVDIYRASQYGMGTPPWKSLVMRNTQIKAIDGGEGELMEISSGIQLAQIDLKSGDYVAIFTSRNIGDAVNANNTKRHPTGFPEPLQQSAIPAFTRMQRRFFTVN